MSKALNISRGAQRPAVRHCSFTEQLRGGNVSYCMNVKYDGGKEKQTCRQMGYYPVLPLSVLSPPSVRKKHT